MQTDDHEEKAFAAFEAALDARDREREKVVIADYYRQRAAASLRDLARSDFPSY